MWKYLPRVGWERFECFNDGTLIDPSNTKAMSEAIMFRWAFVIGWGVHVWWAAASVDMNRMPPTLEEGQGDG